MYENVHLQGHDTTAMGISWALFLIGHSPVEQRKVHDELDSIFGDDTERPVNHEDMKAMTYLECVIKVAFLSFLKMHRLTISACWLEISSPILYGVLFVSYLGSAKNLPICGVLHKVL